MVATSPVGNQACPSASVFSGLPPSPLKYSRRIHGPRTSRSPNEVPSHGRSPPSSPTIFISTPYRTRPCFVWTLNCSSGDMPACLALNVHAVPSGLISVMPQAWSTWTPYFCSKSLIIAGGQAEPPITVRFMVENFRPLASVWASRPCHTVGTPAEQVTFSASKSSYSDLPSRCAPGNTILQPTIAPTYGRPHALTWNMGTTGRTTSRAETLSASGSAAASVCSTVERWLYRTPLGLPVVPDV